MRRLKKAESRPEKRTNPKIHQLTRREQGMPRVVDALQRLGVTPYSESIAGPFRESVSWSVGVPLTDIEPDTTGQVRLIKSNEHTNTTLSKVTNPHAVALSADKRVLVHELDGWEGMVAPPFEYTSCEIDAGPINMGGPT